MLKELQPLDWYVDAITRMSTQQGHAPQQIEERIRCIEIMWIHARGGWVEPMFMTRAMNFMCNPALWEDWKQRGGDGLDSGGG